MSEREWQAGDRVIWGNGQGPGKNGEVVQVHYCVLTVRWDSGYESVIAAGSPWLKRVGSA